MKKGNLLVNNEQVEWNGVVKKGDMIILLTPDVKHKVFRLDFPVIYEDEYLAVINKPAGYTVSGNTFKTIQNALENNLKSSSLPDAFSVPRPVHRLDLQTSGLLIVAKNNTTAIDLSRQFEEKTIQKRYLAICKNTFPDELIVTLEIDELEAETHFKVLKNFSNKFLGDLCLVEARPVTGRTHQIRRHLAANGYPILGDKVYGEYFNKGLFLQASSVEFHHSIIADNIKLELELPNKFLNILNHLK